MNKPYESIPRQGRHRGNAEGLESGMNVRAPAPPDLGPTPEKPQPVHQLLFNEKKGLYRLRLWAGEEAPEPAEEYAEVARYSAEEGLEKTFGQLPDEPRYFVLENTRTGEVFFEEESNISDDWTNDGRYDQFTVFRDEADAAAYAEARQQELGNERQASGR